MKQNNLENEVDPIQRRIILEQIVANARENQRLAKSIGINNISQPGLIKEIIMSLLLNHKIIPTKHNSDACDLKDPSIKYEYLSFIEGGSGQFDRMFKIPEYKRERSLSRISRNNKVYLGVFYEESPLTVKTIYETEPSTMMIEAERQLDKSENDIAHLSFKEEWAKKNGIAVFNNLEISEKI
jgi:hypothetical protein